MDCQRGGEERSFTFNPRQVRPLSDVGSIYMVSCEVRYTLLLLCLLFQVRLYPAPAFYPTKSFGVDLFGDLLYKTVPEL